METPEGAGALVRPESIGSMSLKNLTPFLNAGSFLMSLKERVSDALIAFLCSGINPSS